jgi:hypothetical protein
MFATVPGSSINSWDSWFIFILLLMVYLFLLYDILHDTSVHEKRSKRMLVVKNKFAHTTVRNLCDFGDVNFPVMLTARLAVG